MADVFISYSRRDSEFVNALADTLRTAGKDVWLDVEGIRDGEVFPLALRTAVEASDSFLFVVSPDSVASRFCSQEVDHAISLNKRIVPVVLRPVPDDVIPREIRERNWISFADESGYDAAANRVVDALNTDLAWTKAHTRWLLKALDWDGASRDASFLLRGSELGAAEDWIRGEAGKQPTPTVLQREFIDAGRTAAARRQRNVTVLSALVAVASAGLLVFALISRHQTAVQRSEAQAAAVTAQAKALSAESATVLPTDPELGVLLGVRAVHTAVMPESLFALGQALDASLVRRALPRSPCPVQGVGAAPDVVYLPSGQQLLESACGRRVRLVDDTTGRTLRRLDAVAAGLDRDNAFPLGSSPDGRLVAVGTGRGVVVADSESGRTRAHLGQGKVDTVAFSPDSRYLAFHAGGHPVKIWDSRTGRNQTLTSTPSSAAYVRLTFNARATDLIVATTGPPSGGVRVYDRRSGDLKVRLALPSTIVTAVDVGADGTMLAIGNYRGQTGYATVWSTADWRRVSTVFRRTNAEVQALAVSPSGRDLAIGFADGGAGTWSIATHRRETTLAGNRAIMNVIAFRPDGREIVTATADGIVKTWAATNGESVRIAAPISVGELRVATGRITGAQIDGWLAVWDVRTGALIHDPKVLVPDNGYASLFPRLSPDGSLVLATLRDGHVAIRTVVTQKTVRTFPRGYARSASFSPDNRTVAVFSGTHSLIADVRTEARHALEGPKPGCNGNWETTSFSDDGRRVAGTTYCGLIAVWDVASGRRLRTFHAPSQVYSFVRLGPGGREMVVGLADGTTAIGTVSSGRLRILRGHTRAVNSTEFSPDGRLLATVGLEGTVRIWDVASGRTLRVINGPDGQVVFTPDGRDIVTSDSQRMLEVWPACPACADAVKLLRIAATRVTRDFTPDERLSYLRG